MKKEAKTNALRILDTLKIGYQTYSYDGSEFIDGKHVATAINKDYNQVFKTLVGVNNHNYYVFVIGVDKELDFKKCARVPKEKAIELVPINDLLKISGYVRGGCSFIGMKKNFQTYIDEEVILLDKIVFSAGRVGLQVEINVEDLNKLDYVNIVAISKDH
ncbi:MAG: aminoacyl-tRNA deacylase [Erysipelotrichaceae bacterium]